MLNFALKGTYQDSSGYDWDYYRDDQLDPNPDPNAFYIIPKPQFVTNAQGQPSIDITTYQTSDSSNGSGVCRFDVELSVPADVETAISQQILGNPTKFPGVSKPNFISLELQSGSVASFALISDSAVSFTTTASNYGSNVASFYLQLSATQLKAFKAALVNAGGAFDLKYYLTVPARLQSVSAVLSFDSSIAYQYQVTQPTYNSWGDQTSPGSVQALLQESASSNVKITWGITNPPQSLVKDVTTWANTTLASLVQAEVQKAIAIQGLQSDNSFNINEVSSFTNNYSENMVVNWTIQPTATLPSFQNMGLNINDYEQVVNTQTQVMTVATNLPFASGYPKNGFVPHLPSANGISDPILIESVDITVYYPTLQGGQSTFTLTDNQSQSVQTAYDTNQGAIWSLAYVVNYQQTPGKPTVPTVKGQVNNIDMGSYTLQVEECGILTVTFDAQQAFSAEGTKPTEVDVNFSYVTDQNVNPINQTLKLSTQKQIGSLVSLQAFPINKGYNYQVTYVFSGSVTYQAPLVQNQTGSQQIIGASNEVRVVNLIVFEKADQANNNPLLEVTVNMWYDGDVNAPSNFSGSLPTQASPAVFTLTPNPDNSGNLIARDQFVGLATADQPLVYSASVDTANGETDISAQPIQNTAPSILITQTQRYFTLEINPAAINWSAVAFSSVEVMVNMTVAQGTATGNNGVGAQPQRALTWNKGETGSKYLTYSIQEGNTVSYECKLNYITPGQNTQEVDDKNLSDIIFNIPAKP